VAAVRAPVVRHFAELFEVDVTELRGDDAHDFLRGIVGTAEALEPTFHTADD
jgi:hypothetical protein